MRPDIHEAAQGRWRGILSTYGLTQQNLSGRQGPCPICGGKDRFRFDDKGGRGTWFCNQCGAGSGLDMVMKLRGWDFRTAVDQVRPLVGVAAAEPIKPGMSDEEKRRLRIDLWRSSVPIAPGDMVDQYLRGRACDQPSYPATLRFCPECRYAEGVFFPAMVAAIQDKDGLCVSLHRTFLKDGHKAPVDSPRMVMPGVIPNGSAVRLAEHGEVLGIAEGIETAFSAGDHFQVPTWAALNANLLAEWEPPVGATEVVIFGDNDENYTGQAAAHQLARRLYRKGIKVSVQVPPAVGEDWNDVWIRRLRSKSGALDAALEKSSKE
ncbi:toprim domain-containing protein [Cereibacter sphaeroides]|uniref:DUF7146 domain-containing protein n=1 Tax=Cereibacter sphaeroides TaxID=1063 RepID=UPI001F1AF912|nr:toprim domain-containing protein [Cereibacter sphaeroides]MCE6959995.1 toprim domain-containing protein [Cereibacter sphaeroides]MCE6973080.1 toprim domain-containing protein [Cereibacter sphaeroides]